MRLILTLVLAASVASACALGDEDPTYPLPASAIAWSVPTQLDAGPSVCPSTRLAPLRIDWDATHRSLSVGGEKVLWPRGFSARLLPSGRLDILAPDGSVVARDGDTVAFGGSDYLHVCRVQGVEY
jgi:hypothetical protein